MTLKTKVVQCGVSAVIAGVLGMYTGSEMNNAPRTMPTSLWPDGNPLRVSEAGLEVIGNAEGCRKDPYKCPAGRLTSGVGHAGSDVSSSVAEYSDKQIQEWFAQDVLNAQWCLERYVESSTGHALPQGVLDAYTSFVFNMGCTKFRSYPVYDLLKKEDYKGACDRLLKYTYSGGVELAGLKSRRQKERALCLSD